MATTKVVLDKRSMGKDGKYPIKVQITNLRKTAYVNTKITVEERHFTGDNMNCVAKNVPNSKNINAHVAQMYMEVQKALFELEREGKLASMPPADIVKYVNRDREKPAEPMTFTEYMKQYMEKAKSEGTRKTYDYTLATLERFAGGAVRFADISTPFLRKLDDDMEDAGIGMNTRGIVMRNIRAVVNRAIDEDLFPQGDYPFRKFKIKSQVKEPDCLSMEEFRAFAAYEPVSPCEQMCKDAFMLSFFLCGANLKDIYHMEKARDGKVSFVREKTRRKSPNPVHLTVQPEAAAIIKRIAGKETLVDFSEKYDYETCTDRCKRSFQRMKRKIGLHALSMYYARYTWASVADSLGVDEKVISKSLGHTDVSVAGRHYIKYDWTRTDEANRRVIDWVLYGKK